MRDGYGRVIDYLRISVTDRCNFRCAYCMPPEGISWLDPAEVLSYEELLRVIRILGGAGVNKVRLTGGEPLVRKDMTGFVRGIRELGVIEDLAMTTNGSLLADLAQGLKEAGLNRVNISIDTVADERFAKITGQGVLEDTLKGIESAVVAGLNPVKLNVVLTEVLTPEDVFHFIALTFRQPIAVRFIEYMPVGRCGVKPGFSIAEVKALINRVGFGRLEAVSGGAAGNGPAKYYRLPRGQGLFGFITPISEHFCQSCNRIRLTADGRFKPCLLADEELDIRSALRGGATDRDILELFSKAIKAKPMRHRLSSDGEGADLVRSMFQVGG